MHSPCRKRGTFAGRAPRGIVPAAVLRAEDHAVAASRYYAATATARSVLTLLLARIFRRPIASQRRTPSARASDATATIARIAEGPCPRRNGPPSGRACDAQPHGWTHRRPCGGKTKAPSGGRIGACLSDLL